MKIIHLLEVGAPPVGVSPDQFKADISSGKPFNYDYLDAHAQNNLTGDISHIGDAEREAISTWTSPPGYKAINGHVRNMNGDPVTAKRANDLNNAVMGHPLPQSTWVYRGIHGPHAENLDKLMPGDTFHNKGFASTTIDPKRATHFARGSHILAMHLPEGHPALYVSHPSLNNWTDEKEMLLPHNTHFRYNGREDINAPEHDYSGNPTGKTKPYRMHHVEVIPNSKGSVQIDK